MSENGEVKRGPGRPKGSKNKKPPDISHTSSSGYAISVSSTDNVLSSTPSNDCDNHSEDYCIVCSEDFYSDNFKCVQC